MTSRRELLGMAAAALALPVCRAAGELPLISRAVPSTGEKLPVVVPDEAMRRRMEEAWDAR